MDCRLSAAESAAMERDGFGVREAVFATAEIAEIAQECEQWRRYRALPPPNRSACHAMWSSMKVEMKKYEWS